MSEKERIKVKLDLFKTLIVTLLTALFGILGYAVLNYQSFNEMVSVAVIVGIIILVLGLIFLARQFSKGLDELGGLK